MRKHQGIKPSRDLGRIDKRQTRSIYDELHSSYEKLYGEEQKEKHNLVLEEIRIKRSHTVLDVGCGNGTLAHRLSRKSRLVVAIDLSSNMTRVAKRLCRQDSRCEVILGDAEHLPFRKNSFHILLAITVILDPPSARRTIHEVRRILSGKGIAVLTLIAKASQVSRTQFLIRQGFHGWKLRKIRVGSDLGFFAERRP